MCGQFLSTTSLIKLGSVFALHVVEGGGIVGLYENNDLVLPCNKLS